MATRARSAIAQLAGKRGRALARRLRPSPAPATTPTVVRFARPGDGPPIVWPMYPPPRYLGQLAPSFQSAMAAARACLREEDCEFYHSVELPDGRTIDGYWDLRGQEDHYLGGIELGGSRVLELGPASGGLTFWMERQGARVVALDAGFDLSADLVPFNCGDLIAERLDMTRVMGATQNAWWYLHRLFGSKAAVVYAPIYELPADLGRFDVSVFGSILLHLRRPFDALEQAARVTDRTIIVTEAFDPHLEGIEDAVMRWNPSRERHAGTLWWSFTPELIQEMLLTLGFPNSWVRKHDQLHRHGHDPSGPKVAMPMFTVVATR